MQFVDHRIGTIASSFILFSSPSNTAPVRIGWTGRLEGRGWE
jgi:hypothetical protein